LVGLFGKKVFQAGLLERVFTKMPFGSKNKGFLKREKTWGGIFPDHKAVCGGLSNGSTEGEIKEGGGLKGKETNANQVQQNPGAIRDELGKYVNAGWVLRVEEGEGYNR